MSSYINKSHLTGLYLYHQHYYIWLHLLGGVEFLKVTFQSLCFQYLSDSCPEKKDPTRTPRKKTVEVKGCFHCSLHTRSNWKNHTINKLFRKFSRRTKYKNIWKTLIVRIGGYVMVTYVLKAQTEPSNGLYGYNSPPITIMYALSKLCINVSGQLWRAYSNNLCMYTYVEYRHKAGSMIEGRACAHRTRVTIM